MVDVDSIIEEPIAPPPPAFNETAIAEAVLPPRYVFNSTFAEHDLDNVFEIYPHGELNSDLGGQ